jgi:hypothetical protein
MMDLKVDKYDLIVKNGDLALCVTFADLVRQDINIRLRTLAGEWFLDPGVGIPYLTKVFGQRPNKLSLQEIFRQSVLASPHIVSLQHSNVEFDPSSGILTFAFDATMTDGSTLSLRDSLGGPNVLGI